MSFRSISRHGFVRIAACTTVCAVADPDANVAAILRTVRAAHARSAALAVFPELAVSGYAIDDLLLQDRLLDGVERALQVLIAGTSGLMPLVLVGAPLRHGSRLYNCALAIHRGRLLGGVPKLHLPNYREFYEHRHFASGLGTEGGSIRIGAHEAPFGPDLIFAASDVQGFVVRAEICEDLWVPIPPSCDAALAGASVLANLSASNITIDKAETRRRDDRPGGEGSGAILGSPHGLLKSHANGRSGGAYLSARFRKRVMKRICPGRTALGHTLSQPKVGV